MGLKPGQSKYINMMRAKGSAAIMSQDAGLKRELGLFEVTLSGVGIILGAGFGWRSGRIYYRLGNVSDNLLPGTNTNLFNSWGPYYSLDPPGTHRLGHAWWLDLRLIKDFSIGDTELSVIVDAFNVTNNQTGYNIQNKFNSAGYGDPRSYFDPRRFQVMAKIEF